MFSAIITGASSGLGVEFIKQVSEKFTEIDTFYLIARRLERLEEISKTLTGKTVKILALDLADKNSFVKFKKVLEEDKPNVRLLINNAGLGYFGSVKEIEYERQVNSCDVNVTAVTAITAITLPYMTAGGKIIFTSSIASFVPNAYMTVYSSTKAYITSYARALRYELKKEKISVTVVCPGPMATEFLIKGEIKSKTFDALPYCDPIKVVSGTLKYAKKGKFIYTNRLFFKFYRLLAKILPTSWLVPIAKT